MPRLESSNCTARVAIPLTLGSALLHNFLLCLSMSVMWALPIQNPVPGTSRLTGSFYQPGEFPRPLGGESDLPIEVGSMLIPNLCSPCVSPGPWCNFWLVNIICRTIVKYLYFRKRQCITGQRIPGAALCMDLTVALEAFEEAKEGEGATS